MRWINRKKRPRRFPSRGANPGGRPSRTRLLRTEALETRELLAGDYPIVDTGQVLFYDATSEITAPAQGDPFYGQDAQFDGNQPSYTTSADGLTVYDNVTGLTWTQGADWTGDGVVDVDDKFSYADAQTYVDTLNAENYGGFNDWRVPTIKDLYSLIDYRGTDPNPMATDPSGLVPFIDDDVFEFAYGDTSAGERIIDSQWATSTLYVSTVMGGQQAMFGVNFADGRIKGYPAEGGPGGVDKTYYARYVRGNADYGTNSFTAGGDGTVTDSATGLMWSQDDNGVGLNWEDALAWVEQMNAENYLGHNDWRLPNAKELQSLVDYTRSPDTTGSAAIAPVFNATQITNLAGQTDYGFYWSGTSFLSFNGGASSAVYVAFGRGMGTMDGVNAIDVHGAGCQRSDPKDGNPDDYPSMGHGPQGDVQRVFNFVRLVRDADTSGENAPPTAEAGGPYTGHPDDTITLDASGSTDTDGTVVFYEWDLDNDGDYDDATGVTAGFTASAAGTYTVGLQVTDDGGATATDTATVSITERGEPFEGYNLFSSLGSTTVYLMDNDGTFVHSWDTGYRPGNSMYFLEDGELLHTGNVGNATFNAGGAGGIVQTFDWDGNVTWEYGYSSATHLQHHDVEMLPGGNVLLIAWQCKTQAEAVAAGRDPSLLTDGELWPDSVIEIEPTGPTSGNIVWEWHAWDHLVQDYDPTKANYGAVADHPELIDLNYVMLGGGADWSHVNSVDYNADLDEIVLSVHNFGEIWVIDHSTTTAEAAGHSGGNSGSGGDLLYRWGNPQTYDAGTAADQQLFGQHDAEWIEAGLPGEGNILIFNNGQGRPGGNYSSIDEIVTPVNADGSYTLVPGSDYGPDAPLWTYTADVPTDFFAQNISGQQRLPNGNTLICSGPDSYFFEVDAAGETVWEYDATGAVFRVERYAPSYAGFDGTPLDDDPPNEPPTAEAGGPYAANVGSAITLDGSRSTDSDGTIVSYEWDLDNDGQYDDAIGVTAGFTASAAGTYTVGLQVTDDAGAQDTDTAAVTVTAVSTELKFDFGTPTSPVAAGYTQVTRDTAYTAARGYGWLSGTVKDSDRSGLGNDLTRDFNYSRLATFAADVPNGNYDVTVIVGNPGPYAHDQMGIFLEGTQVDSVDTPAGQVVTRTYEDVAVADGQLTLLLDDLGGRDPNVVIEALEIVSAGPDTAPPTVTDRSPAPGATVGGSAFHLDATFSEEVVGVDASDLVLSGAAAASASVGTPTDLGGNTWRFPVSGLTDGTLDVTLAPDGDDIEDTAGNDLATLTWDYTVDLTPPPAELKFDFGTPASPVEAGYTQITRDTAYTLARGYGWLSGTVKDSDRSGLGNDLTRDFNYSRLATFAADVPNGSYDVTVIVGNPGPYAHDRMGIFLEGTQVDSVDTSAGQVVTKTYENVAVTDGQLTLLLDDLGGRDPNVVIEALEIVSAGPDTAPPTVTDLAPSPGAVVGGSTFHLDVTFSEEVVGVDASDLVLSGAAASSASVGTPTDLGGNTWRFPVSGLTDGTLDVTLAPDGDDIEDTSGNDLATLTWDYTVDLTPPPAELKFDFGTPASPVAGGYTQVTRDTAYTAARGYGWLSGTVGDSDRPEVGNDLTRDFNYTRLAPFAADVPNGNYDVTVIVGNPVPYAHDRMGIFLEGTQVDSVDTSAGQVVTRTYEDVAVADGQLTLLLDDLGGRDPNVVIEALEVTQRPASGGDAAAARDLALVEPQTDYTTAMALDLAWAETIARRTQETTTETTSPSALAVDLLLGLETV